jgi:TM2 domain-containing membrane protein YozV
MEIKEIIGWVGMLLATFWAGIHMLVAGAIAVNVSLLLGAFVGMFVALSIISGLVFLLNWKKYYLPNIIFWLIMLLTLFVGYVQYIRKGDINALFTNVLAGIALVIDIIEILLALVIWKIDKE